MAVAGGADLDTLWDFDRPAESETRFRALLAEVDSGRDRALAAEIKTQIARTQGLQRRFDDAHATLDEVEPALGPEMRRAHVRYLLERGRVFNSSGHPEQSAPFFEEALELGKAAGESYYAVDAAHMLGIVEPSGEALAWNLRAIAMAEEDPNDRANQWLGSLYNNTAWSYHVLGRYEDALDLFRKAQAWQSGAGRAKETRIANWTVARCLRSLGRYDEALALQWANLDAVREAGHPDGFVQEELGECLLALDRADEARPHFAAAFEVLGRDAWLQADEPERLSRLKELAER